MAKTVPARPVFGTLNEHLICTLCKGYLVDSTTIVECLHSFCRSCIVQYLQASSFCPTCEVQLHKGSPLRSLKPDKTLQDIVFKLVPNLFHSEMQRRRVYYDAHPQYVDQTTPEQRGDCLERFYSPDDSISLSLEYHDRRKSIGRESSGDQKVLPPKRYLKCPALFTVGLLKKFVRYKFDLPQEIVIDIFQRRESLADEYTLLDIAYIYPWKRSEPMKFFYSVRDPRIPESDEEVEREMPSLSAAVSGRATRASRRASSASSLASPRASPRASPVPSGRRATESPPPAKLTTRPPSGATQPKAVSGTPTSPKITLTISPSRGTVTASTGEPVSPDDAPQPVRSPPPVTKPVGKISTTAASKPVTVVPSKPATPVVGKSVTNALSKPVAPVESKPLTAVPSKPAAPVVCRPATPAVGKPTAPIPSKPVATTAGKPSASVENKATTHVLTKVVAPLAGKTATLVTSKTATPVTSKPSVSVTNQATTPTGSKAVVNRGAASTPLAVPNKRNGTPNGVTPAAAPPPKIGAVPHTPQATAFPATVTTKTLNGGFVTVKNPVGRPANGMSVGHKTKRHSNGLPVLAPKPVATPPESRASQAGPGRPHAPSVASNTRPTTATPKTASAAKTDETSADEEKNKVETAEAILQLSRGFKPSRCNTPTDKQLHKDIDQIVKHLQDDESNDSTLVIKSEPASPAPSQDSPRDSPVPPPATATAPATTPLPPALPKVNGLTITPIDPVKRKSSTPTSAVADKRPKMDVPAKRPSDTSAGSATPSKMPKVDRIADSIKQKQLLRQQEPAATPLNRPPTPRPLSHKPALNAPKPSSSLAAQPPGGSLPKPQPVKTFPPAQVIPLGPQTAPVLAQPLKATPQSAGKSPAPVALRPNKLPHLLPKPVQTGQRAAPPKPTQQFKPITVQQGKPSSQEPVQQTKPVNIANAPHAKIMNGQPATPASASSNLGQLTKVAGSPQNSAPKSVSFLQAQQGASTGNSQQAKPAGSPLGQQTGTTNNLQGQAKLSSGQQAAPFSNRQGQQAKLTTVQQAKLDTKPVSTQQGKPVTTQPPRPSPPCQQSPSKSASPESPIKSKKPMPDLQRLQRPPSSLTGTTVNGSLSLAEVKEHLAKKGQYSPPLTSPPSQVNRTPPRLVEISQQQRKSAPAVPSYGALDLSSASPRASDHGGSWTPPPSLAQALAKRQQVPIAARPPPSSLSSSSPSPPADELFPDPTVLAQQQALFQHLQQLQNLMQVQAGWAASDRIGVKATAKRK